MAAVLLLDLDDTLADRDAAFLAWVRSKARQWAPNQPDAVAFLIERDADGMCPRGDFFALVAERFGLNEPVEALVADFRRELRAALPPLGEHVKEQLSELRAAGWKIALVTNGDADGQAGKVDQLGLPSFLDGCCISGALGVRKPDPASSRSPPRSAAKRSPVPGWSVIRRTTSSVRTGPASQASGCTAAGSGRAMICDRTTRSRTSPGLSR